MADYKKIDGEWVVVDEELSISGKTYTDVAEETHINEITEKVDKDIPKPVKQSVAKWKVKKERRPKPERWHYLDDDGNIILEKL
jgi:hypothetical protein